MFMARLLNGLVYRKNTAWALQVKSPGIFGVRGGQGGIGRYPVIARRHCERSEAIHWLTGRLCAHLVGLPRRFAPRKDGPFLA
jgi:hypothetical protein